MCHRRFPKPYMRRRSLDSQDAPVLVQVGDVGEGLVAEPAGGQSADARLGVQLPVEALGEGQQLGVVEALVLEHQHPVAVHALPDLRQSGLVSNVPEVDRAYLGHERGVEGAKRERHADTSAEDGLTYATG